MAARRPLVGWSDLPYAGGVALIIAFALFTNYSGFLNQPYATFAACGGLLGAFIVALGWIRARSMAIKTEPAPTVVAKKAPKVMARKVPKQEQANEQEVK